MKIVRTDEEINTLLNECIPGTKSKFPGMTYEDGIRAVMDWLIDEETESPME